MTDVTSDMTVQPVLVVDDDAPVRDLVVQVLEDEGYAVETAADGAEALAWLRDGGSAPRLILLDWCMPTPGDVFAREYRALPGPHAPILVLTAGDHLVDAVVGAGARGVLPKPFELDELLDFVARIAGPPDGAGPARPRGRRDAVKSHARRAQELRRIAHEVHRLLAALGDGRVVLQGLLEAETRRPLTPEEVARVRDLRWECERLSRELSLLHDRFERIRSARRGQATWSGRPGGHGGRGGSGL